MSCLVGFFFFFSKEANTLKGEVGFREGFFFLVAVVVVFDVVVVGTRRRKKPIVLIRVRLFVVVGNRMIRWQITCRCPGLGWVLWSVRMAGWRWLIITGFLGGCRRHFRPRLRFTNDLWVSCGIGVISARVSEEGSVSLRICIECCMAVWCLFRVWFRSPVLPLLSLVEEWTVTCGVVFLADARWLQLLQSLFGVTSW